ncbi:MAG: molybdopterin molybdotransferase MoeA [Alphaproteobacteria bacterium]|jgi:molybdopterin molybdotransferase|nr:molybdopterin molybdotransferase MoeA [Alphaproteobacteria bacterium]
MSQLSDDCFAFGGPLMTTAEALRVLTERVSVQVDTEEVGLDAAVGRILGAPVVAGLNVPPHDNAAVDGYAFRHRDLDPAAESRLAVVGRAAAGHPFEARLGAGQAVRIFTGAVMAAGADTVVMQEDVRLDGDAVLVPPGLKKGANRRAAGEDVAAGDTVLRAGQRLRAQEVGLAATVGRDRLSVYRPLQVAVFSTGDELREPGAALPPGAIYDANRHLLKALLAGLHCRVSDLGILADDARLVTERLAEAAGKHDLLLTSGGVSTGEEDHVKAAVEATGSLHFWRLAIKPGRPLALGQVAGTAFVGLPGNPVAAMVCFLRFARPLVLKLAGAVDLEPFFFQVPADFEHSKKPDRREWLRARLVADRDGGLKAQKFERQGSGIITSLVDADGLVEIPEDVTHLAKGSLVDFLPFNEVTS